MLDLVAKLYGTRVFDRNTRVRVSAEVVFTHALYGCTRRQRVVAPTEWHITKQPSRELVSSILHS